MPSHAVMLQPPRDEQVFEDLCLDLFAALWGGAQLYGRRGHAQKGIDLYGTMDGVHVAVQCKKREGKLSKGDVEKDVKSARALDPPLAKLIFATTAKRDPDLQDFVRQLNDGEPFEVEVWFWEDLQREIGRHDDIYRLWEPILGAAPPLVAVDRLPSTILPKLMGRDDELALLEEAWAERTIHVLTFVAVGGAGKTALVHHWLQGLEEAGWKARGAAAAFAWSFYSQGGGGDRQASGDAFIDAALRFFGDRPAGGQPGGEGAPPPSPRDRGLRLAELVRRRRTLLVLDGLEPLQEPPASAQAGKVKDPAVAALIRTLAADNPGLLVITSREPVADLESRDGRGARTHDLDQLSDTAGAALLRWLGVEGKAGELAALSAEVHGHAFTLTLLGTYLRDAHGGDVRAWKDLPLLSAAEIIDHPHASQVMAAYARWFGAGPERQILSLLGLFDRPADAEAVKALRREPPIPGLADQLVDLSPRRWNVALERLRRARLLLKADAAVGGARPKAKASEADLDAHPLVREHFGRLLERDDPEAYRAGHQRLYEHYAAATHDLPDTLEAMQPLYLAIGHGCRAGRRQEVYDEIYLQRVQRGNEFYSVKKLGAFGADLTALAGFFDRPWDAPAPELRAGNRAWLLNSAGAWLQALGRLAEAVEPMEASMEMDLERTEWKGAAISASNLSELALTLGQVDRAVAHARTSVELADRSGDLFQRVGKRSTLGDALHAAGELDEAEALFRQAEALQAELQPQYPKLYSLQGYRYCDLLLSRAEPLDGSALGQEALASASEDARRRCQGIRERTVETLQWMLADPGAPVLTVAVHHLSLGRATLGLALATGGDPADALEPLSTAVQGLRTASAEHHLPRGLLARATLHRFRGDEATAEADLAEALEIAQRASMQLHECDAHLEWARLRCSLGDPAGARPHLQAAQALIHSTGYHRRQREAEDLARALEVSPPPPAPEG